MDQSTPPASAARAVRLLHGFIAFGLVVIGAVFTFVVRMLKGPALAQVPRLGTVVAVVAGGLLLLAVALLRPRVPHRDASQSPDAFWADPATRGQAVLLWVAVEAAGIIASIGYLFTAATLPAVAAVVAIAILLLMGPARLES